MERPPPGGRRKAVDIWEHVTVMNDLDEKFRGKRAKCNHCGLVFAASANRIRCHIKKIKGQGVQICSGFPPPNNTGSNKGVTSHPMENLTDSQGLSISDRPTDDNKLIMAPRQLQMNAKAKHQERIHQVGPFSVSTMLNEHDSHLIQYVFEYSCETDTIFSSSRSFLKKAEFMTLKPGALLDSLVIDIFAEILTDVERKKTPPWNWYLPLTTFSNAALTGDVRYFLDFVQRNSIRESYMSDDLVNCEKIFIPVHIQKNPHGHFYLYILHLKNQKIEIWDSLSHQFSNEKEYDETTHKLMLLLDVLFMNVIRGSCGPFTKFHCRIADDHLLQPNEYDCGIFVINFMQQSANYVKRNSMFQFDSEEERLDLALRLLKNDLNEQKETLCNKAARRHFSQGGNEEDSDLSGLERKRVDTCEAFPENVGRGPYTELNDSNRRVKGNNAGMKTGCFEGYIFPAKDLVGGNFEGYTEEIWEWIMDDEVSAIGIWGMGGSGKTALATYMHNKLLEEAVGGKFNHVIWVTASQHTSICELQKVVATSINLDIYDEYEVKRIAGKVLQAFKGMNKCVLILDDVWDHIFLEEVGFPISDNRIKLILTTRLWEVCQSMNCRNIIKVESLGEKDSWALFKQTLGVHDGLPLEVVEKIATDILKYCGGLPLAIVTIARSMKGKKQIGEWSHMLECLENSDYGQCGINKWVFPVLRYSYTFLNDKLQRFFLYCALSTRQSVSFSNASHLKRRFVYEEWVDERKKLKVHYNEGNIMLDKLLKNSLLQKIFFGWRMHYLLWGMAIGIANETSKIMAKVYMNLTEIPDDENWNENLQKVFLTGIQIQKIPDGTSPRCSRLSTLLLDCNYNLECISNDFFINMPALKVLDLSKTHIKRLPDSISNLKCLIALLLSKCSRLRYVPSLAKLQRLISLELSETAITKVPSGLESLVKLRCLNLLDTINLKMRTSVMSKLTNLQFLGLRYNPNSEEVRAEDLQGLEKLEVIVAYFCDIQKFNAYVMSLLDRDCALLKSYHLYLGLANLLEEGTFDNADTLYGVMKEGYSSKNVIIDYSELGNEKIVLPNDMKELFIKYCPQGTNNNCPWSVLSFNKNNRSQIELLKIEECDKVEYLCCLSPGCPFCSLVQNLETISVWQCESMEEIVSPNAASLHEYALLSYLKRLEIIGCNNMKTLLTPELLAQLQNLETISVSFCESMEEIVGIGNLSHHTLPKLKSVELLLLPELNFVYRGIMLCPSLQRFSAKFCKKLNRPQIEISNGCALQFQETEDGYHYGKE